MEASGAKPRIDLAFWIACAGCLFLEISVGVGFSFLWDRPTTAPTTPARARSSQPDGGELEGGIERETKIAEAIADWRRLITIETPSCRHEGTELDLADESENVSPMLYESENVKAFLRLEGYLELIIAEHRSLPWADCQGIAAGLRESGVPVVRVLVSRFYRYGPPADYLLHDLTSGLGVRVAKVAYHAPLPTAQTLSHVVAETALRSVPHKVFSERERAVAWLLEA